jgi:hypothetical protein
MITNKMPKDVHIYETMPDGWVESQDATTAPNGFVWINNRKPVFDKEYRHSLLRKNPIRQADMNMGTADTATY